ncbi:diacylglycerol kinase [Williamsia sp.]|uniref:NAD(P)H-dependent amine dehydrogenase family protein n=1 Tax=Williamsia sp. TaxID=1872085 RepID=UPI002F9249E3
MAIRVALIGTGNVGHLALIQLITSPDYELMAVGVSTESKIGKDAGELAGLDIVTGVTATDDLDALIATRPDCVVYCAMGDTRTGPAIKDCQKILEAGINVVGSAPVILQFPWKLLPDKYIDRVEASAQQGDVSIFITGVDPGFANDLLPLALAGTCQRVEQIRVMEIADYATYDGATVMVDVMGFGRPLDEVPVLFQPGVLGLTWGTTIRQLAVGLGIEVDEITETFEQEPAPEAFDVAVGRIDKGTVAAMRFEIHGKVNGHSAIVVEHVTRLRDDLRPDWARPAQEGGSYRIEIIGEPSYAVDICPTSEKGDHNHAAIVAAAGRIVNAIPVVLDAPAGLRTTLDLPLVTGKGLYTGSVD